MATLDRWRSYLATPRTIAFPKLEMRGRDFEPTLLAGEGEVRIPTLNRFEYTLRGKPADGGYLFEKLRYQQQNPYDGLARFRLVGTDSDGTDWSLGWTVPDVILPDGETWTFQGRLDGLLPHDAAATVAEDSGTEVIFAIPTSHPMARSLARFVQRRDAEGQLVREHAVEAMGSSLRFTYEPDTGILSITATHSAELPPTYTENWLGEPLVILFGQLIYPRLTARNLGDRRTHVFIRRSPHLIEESGWAALWSGDDINLTKDDFWQRYAQLLTLIARARTPEGYPNFEANKVTYFYAEIIQASAGTRWVWALTLASCIEGLANLIHPPGRLRPDADEAAVRGLADHIKAWSGGERLKQIAINAAHRAMRTTTIFTLRGLAQSGTITAAQLEAWESVRNSVMHGSLVSPYSSEEEDAKLLALVQMMHALTVELLQGSGDAARNAS